MNPANSQEALAQLQQQQAGAKSAADILGNQRQQLGVNAAQDTVTGLRGAITNTTKLLNQVAPSVMGRTANSLVTNAQATRQIANEQQPIAQQLGQTTQDYNTALSDYDRTAQRASEAANLEYGDQQNKLSYLQNLYNTLFEREETARQAQAQEAARQEQVRQFNEQLALERRKAGGSGGGNYFSGLTDAISKAAPTPASPGVSQDLYNSVKGMLDSGDQDRILREFNAITSSAGYGNQSDKTKLQLLYSLRPDLFNGRSNALKLAGV